MRSSEPFSRTSLSEDNIKKLIDDAALRKISIISFTGGEPLLSLSLLVRLINYASGAGIRYIRTGTNGFMFGNPEENGFNQRVNDVVNALAPTKLRNFWISIDSCEPLTHEQMRGFPGVISGIRRALPVFHAAGLYPAANIGINRNMAGTGFFDCAGIEEIQTEQVAVAAGKILSFVKDLGFTMVNMCYPMSIEEPQTPTRISSAVYAATSRDSIVHFSSVEKSALFAGLSEAIATHRSGLRIFTPRASLHALRQGLAQPNRRTYPCRGGSDFFFASSNGNVYPCGYRGNEPLGESWGKDQAEPWCYKCEWECFRDPSELFGPIADLVSAPWRLAHRCLKDPAFLNLWIDDMRYFAACGFHNSRTAPNYAALAKF